MPFGKDEQDFPDHPDLPRGRRTLNHKESTALAVDARNNLIQTYYRALFRAWGPQNCGPQGRASKYRGGLSDAKYSVDQCRKSYGEFRSARLLSMKGDPQGGTG